jgi:hypothetical protein
MQIHKREPATRQVNAMKNESNNDSGTPVIDSGLRENTALLSHWHRGPAPTIGKSEQGDTTASKTSGTEQNEE